eukprot:TRINITY_DN4134_c0_g1_i1.p1 TRINITY_DN4134_c0_g1~~TRINITY_DN4134_c0_g1_i1.p1  ORF type:complete len:629 (+),score=109.32 TRINITY_DN4134_c0_g1_i1:38-1888(+)
MSDCSEDSPPATYDAIKELGRLPALDDIDVDLLKSGDLGWLNDIGSVWSSVHHGRVSCSVSMSSVSGSLDLSAVDITAEHIAEVETALPGSHEQENLPLVEVPPQAGPHDMDTEDTINTELLASPAISPAHSLDYKAIETSLIAEAKARMSLQRQLLELEEERYRVEIIQEQLMEAVKPPLPPQPFDRLPDPCALPTPPESEPEIIYVPPAPRQPLRPFPVPKPAVEYLSPLQAALREMSDCISLLAASSGVTHYDTEAPIVPRHTISLPAPKPAQRRVLVLPTPGVQTKVVPHAPVLHGTVPQAPVYHMPHMPLSTMQRAYDTRPQVDHYPDYMDYAHVPQPELCETIRKQVKGCHVNQVVVTTKYDDGGNVITHQQQQQQQQHQPQQAQPVYQHAEREAAVPRKILAEQTTQTTRVLVAPPTEVAEVPHTSVREAEVGGDVVNIRPRGRGRMPLHDVSNQEPRRNASKDSKSSRESDRSRSSKGSRSRSGGRVVLRGAPKCADAPTQSSLAKMQRRVETWPPLEGDTRPPFRPSSVSPKRKKLTEPLRHRPRVPYRMAISTLTAPTESSLSKIRGPAETEPPREPSVPHTVAIFNRHAHTAHRGLSRLGPGLTA